MAIKPGKTLRKIRVTGKTLRKVKLNKDEIAEALGAEEHHPVNQCLSKEAMDQIAQLINNPPKPNRRLKDAAKRAQECKLPTCPEVCILCRDRVVPNRHIMHVIDELGEIAVRVDEDGKHYVIEGNASAGDLFWLRRILQMGYEAVAGVVGYGEKMPVKNADRPTFAEMFGKEK